MTTEPTAPVVRLAKRKAQLNLLLPVFILLVAAGVVTCLLLIIVQTGRLTEIAETNERNGSLIVDCTTPGGKCFEDGNARTGEAIGTINEVTILAAACAKTPGIDTEAEIRACIEQGLDG